MNSHSDAFTNRLAPYRDVPGMLAALLISRDGLVIAADAEPDFDAEAFAAQAGGVIQSSLRLAMELGESAAKYIAVEFEQATMVLAPFNNELTLALVGRPQTLRCHYSISTAVI